MKLEHIVIMLLSTLVIILMIKIYFIESKLAKYNIF